MLLNFDKLKNLMNKSSDLQVPHHLQPYETLSFSTSLYYKTNFDVLKTDEFSDNCSGQNRNKCLFALYSLASMKFKIKIQHTYLESGHTQSE